ncbi:unnamed protein product [Adineta ricciae]|uniref:LicD/FKTN/FKRP nucleotidyltransferase domain-containing protein n=1 Tax=Adineta ricciae TaxID=249248 RepID=A0A814QKK0_ADIRI|nr:unnamed protein product [Adineta ricciae]CAF1121565.1 unnamed protein product [Adineta ricciae]
MFFWSVTRRAIISILLISLLVSVSLIIQTVKVLPPELAKPPRRPVIFSNRSLNIEDRSLSTDDVAILCLNMADYIDKEQHLPISPIIFSPTFQTPRIFRFPYRYSNWKSSTTLPRALTTCEHNLAMHLLIIIDRICRRHKITYFMSEGTLLGSIRHHDIIPWDDDIDIMMSEEHRQLFTDTLYEMNSTLLSFVVVGGNTKENQYYKVSFKSSPSAGGYKWSFPFVDVFFYTQNDTYLWNLKYPDTVSKLKHVFPLILRPLGQLWLPSPRKPERFFRFEWSTECVGHFWDHRIEKGKQEVRVKCDELKDVYPFVEQANETQMAEVLKINDTILHTIIFK